METQIAENETEPAKEETQEKKQVEIFKSLSSIENVVHAYAEKKAAEWQTGLKPGDFRVLLARKPRGISELKKGHPALIIFQWPDAQPVMNQLLREAFKQIKKYKFVDCWAVESATIIKSRKLESRKWRRAKFGDEAEIIGELIPRRHIVVERVVEAKTTIVIKDQFTGATITREETSKQTEKSDGRHLDVPTWLELSRMARDLEEVENVDDQS